MAEDAEKRLLEERANLAELIPLADERGVEVVNCTPNSAITAFPKRTLEGLLAA